MSKFAVFAALHVPGTPLVLFNAWDAGSAKAVAEAGAKAIATGSWSVAAAHGVSDAEGLPMEIAIANAREIVGAVDLPVTIDFEGGYATDPAAVAANVMRLAETGAVGCNFEDQVIGGDGLHPTDRQAAKIAAIRAAVGPEFFINARTDIFLKTKPATHDAAKVTDALDRARAYADAGASGFFVPGLVDLALLEKVTAGSPLPVNAMVFPGSPTREEWGAAGVARISHGPGPYRGAMAWLADATRDAMGTKGVSR